MTAEEVFCDLGDKYGDDFNWYMIPLTNRTFVVELRREIGEKHFLYNKPIYAVAKCDSNDDVLFLSADDGKDVYYIFHLTYSGLNSEGFPKHKKFANLQAVKEYIEREFIAEYL